MKNAERFAFRKGDMLAIALVALLAVSVAACFALPGDSQQGLVQVWQDGKLAREISLDADTSLEIRGDYLNTIAVQDGRVCFAASDCPGEDCVHSGWISTAGRSLVCLPNRVEIRIAGASDVDFVVR